MIWDACTSQEIADADKRRVVVLPLAATEQHGPHLPLATDRLIAESLCRALDAACPDKVLILPCPPVGYSQHHRGFPGTLSVSHTELIGYAASTIECVLADGFRNVLVLNAHGGNIGLGNVLIESLGERRPGAQIVFSSWWQAAARELREISETGPGGTGHACEFETSLMLHFHPELVRATKVATGTNRPTFAWAEADMLNGCAARLQRSFVQMTENGVYGDPTVASPEKGRLLAEAVVAALQTICKDLYES